MNGVMCFVDFVEFVEFVLELVNDLVFGREVLNKRKEDVKFFKVKELLNKGRELFSKVKMLLRKLENLWKYKESSFVINLFGIVKFLVLDGVGFINNCGSLFCYFCSCVYDLDDCELFNRKILEFKRVFLREKNMCFGCYGINYFLRNCLNK